MSLTGYITSVDTANRAGDVFFRVKEYDTNKLHTCAYSGFLPIRVKDNIKGNIKILDKITWFQDLPLTVIPKNEDSLYNSFFKAFRQKDNKLHSTKVKEIISSFYKKCSDINGIYDYLSAAACDEKVELETDLMSFQQSAIFLRWWKRNIVIRQLHLWQLYDSEIKKSNYLAHELIKVLMKNAFMVGSIELEKAQQLEITFGRSGDKFYEQAKIYRTVLTNNNRGWTAMPLNYLLKAHPTLPNYVNDLKEYFELIFEEDLVYDKMSYEREEFLSDKITNWVQNNKKAELNTNISYPISIEGDITLTPEQDSALQQILNSHLSIVTGGAGCGKTTLIRQLIHNLRKRGEEFLLTSFTGKAVLRMKETLPKYCQEKCYTMSKLIHKKETGQKVPDFHHLIIDESSMISNDLMFRFLDSFSQYFRIYFFGDCNQLPPVGSGNFFQEIINCKDIKKNYLTINKRIISSEEDNIILKNANSLIARDRDYNQAFNYENGNNFNLIEGDIKFCQKLIRVLAKRGIEDSKITVLTPFNKDIPELIATHQSSYLGTSCFNYAGVRYFINDRVMQTKNIYYQDKEIMNGEEGIITSIDKEGLKVKFHADKEIFYKWKAEDPEHLGEEEEERESEITTNYLKHSFCKTVHKAQGSEYDYVIIYLPTSNNSMVNINLIYTAITRAKKMVWVVGDLTSLETASKRKISSSYDRLAQKIEDKLII